MNKNNARDYLPLVQALADGLVIQYQKTDGTWIDNVEFSFDWPARRYRVKPKPKEVWITEYPNGEVFSHANEESALFGRSQPTGVIRRYREVLE